MKALRMKRAIWLFVIGLLLSVLASRVAANPSGAAARDDDDEDDPTRGNTRPKVHVKWVGHQIRELVYFDDSESMLAVEAGEQEGKVYRSDNLGVDWKEVTDLPEGQVMVILLNRFSKKHAVAIGLGEKHWFTDDRGKSWREFKIKGMAALGQAPLVSFHSTNPDLVILNTRTNNGVPKALYTDDGFKSVKLLRGDALRCLWAKEQEHFKTDKTKLALCVTFGRYSQRSKDNRLVMSDDFFKSEDEPALEDGRPAAGIISLVAAKGFLLAARQTPGTNEMALYVTTDAFKWHRADFGDHQLVEGGYTVMESTNYSLQVDVASGPRSLPMGTLFTSNSLGYSFVRNEQYTNRNSKGFVDFEEIAGVQGIVLVNIVENAEDVLQRSALKRIKSQISFDDGRTFEDIKCDGESLQLHSVNDRRNVGRIFSSLAPGLVMGIGNTGPQLEAISRADLYISDDAGRTWKQTRKGAYKYEFGDQGAVLLIVPDGSETDEFQYSLDRGKHWNSINLKDYFPKGPNSVIVTTLTTLPDSTALRFHLTVASGRSVDLDFGLITVDFKDMKMRKCKKDDFETWDAVTDDKGKPKCIMGRTQKFRRRKADAECFVGERFVDPKPEYETCECTDVDYECDAGFQRSQDRKECVPLKDRPLPEGACEKDEKDYEDDSGFRVIPGNSCKHDDKVKKVTRQCPSSSDKPTNNGEIASKITLFSADKIEEFYYLERSDSSTGDDETVILRTDEREVYISKDHGKNWNKPEIRDPIIAIYPHRYMNDQVYLITPSTTVYYSKNRASVFHEMEAQVPPNNVRLQILRFHPTEEDWLIWTGCEKDRGSIVGSQCIPQAWVTRKNGDDWTSLRKTVEACEFVWRDGRDPKDKSLIYCLQHDGEDMKGRKLLLSSNDWFDSKKTLFNDSISFATMSEYIVVAAKTGRNDQLLKIESSVDGSNFANARFPSSLKVAHSNSYTVLDSSTHSIFLHVTINGFRDQEYGTLIKSNSNGTFFTFSLDHVNRNAGGYVDFEKMVNLVGTAVVNVVDNWEQVEKGEGKKLKTMMTHDDGATWSYIPPPEKDAEDKPYPCESKELGKCSLHLHGYTERADPRDSYSSPSAIGLMFGVGNVGEYLLPKRDGNTFLSTDGGITWKTAMNGEFMWEYGDRGAVLVLVSSAKSTKSVYYSLDEGASWDEYEFSDEDMDIYDITTVPSDTSRNFLLWGKKMGFSSRAATVNLDFSAVAKRDCKLDRKDIGSKNSDYYLWEPKHPSYGNDDDNCLFGKVSQYIRKKPKIKCRNPTSNFGDNLHEIKKNCTCTRVDFECDYNFERSGDKDQTCRLVEGLKPLNTKKECKKPGVTHYYEPSGYRRLPLSTCEGGKDLEHQSGKRRKCDGKASDDDDDDSDDNEGSGGDSSGGGDGLSGIGLFFAIVIPIGAAGAIGWWMWRNLNGHIGRIRLGDGLSIGNGNVSTRPRSDWTKYPVMAVSGIVAVVMAVPMMLGLAWRSARERLPGGRRSFYSTYGRSGYGAHGNGRAYTSRDSFSRDGRDYSDGPASDERDLLGDESDEE